MRTWTTRLTFAAAILFALAGTACNFIDIKDHWTVPPTPAPAGMPIQVPTEPESINQAKRTRASQDVAYKTYSEWRDEDIAKQEAKVSVFEGIRDGGLQVFGEQIGMWAGPFAPLATLLIGYKTKRRKDLTPDEAKAAAAKEKEDSYNAGQKSMIAALKAIGVRVPDEVAPAPRTVNQGSNNVRT